MGNTREVLVFSNNQAASRFAVKKWVEISSKSVADKGYFSVALSGGRTPLDFYERLSTCRHPLPWDRTHIFLADERFVPPSDKDSNYGLIKEHLLNHINIPKENMHAVSTVGTTLAESAEKYEKDIWNFFDIWEEGIPNFDLIMLGIGEDGHTASLFPGESSLREEGRLVIPVVADKFPYERISLTLPTINNAKHTIFLVSGENKAKAVKEMLDDRDRRLPAALVKPEKGASFLVMDQPAASLLSETRLKHNRHSHG